MQLFSALSKSGNRSIIKQRACAVSLRKAQCFAVTKASAQEQVATTRRQLLSLALVAPLVLQRPAHAEETASVASTSAPALLPLDAGTPFLDEDYQILPPPQFTFVETNPLLTLETAQGPAKERSPVRSRFDSPEGPIATVSVIVRGASTLRQLMLMQVQDISAFGSPEETAKLVLPRGSTLLNTTVSQVTLPSRTTLTGVVDFPPRTYYRYEFIASNGLHVMMVVAARGGKIYVCGGSAPPEKWQQYGPAVSQAVQSFRLREKAMAADYRV